MRYRHRIVYAKGNRSKEFVDFLKERNAVFEKSESTLQVVYLFEEEEWIDQLYKVLQSEHTSSMIDTIFTPEEFEKAEWLTIRPTFRFEYPQPETYYKTNGVTYDSSNYCDGCGCGLKQKDSFRLKRTPSWGKKHFLKINWVEDEMFVSSAAMKIISDSNITGLEFLNVIKNKTALVLENIHQVIVQGILEPGFLPSSKSVKSTIVCKKCGHEKYITTGRELTFRREIFANLDCDIIKSHETFGPGVICASQIIVSQRFYQLLVKHKLNKDVEFEPLTLV